MNITAGSITLIGHPFAPIGMGELIRSLFRALRSVEINPGVLNVYGGDPYGDEVRREFAQNLVTDFSPELNIFCINGDEVEPTLQHLSSLPEGAFNIIYPAWELSKYPEEWARQLNLFDEIWAFSTFTQESIKSAVCRPVLHLPLSGEINLSRYIGRRYFGIPESSFVFLFFFEFPSYLARKNPFAVLEAFDRLCERCPNEDLYLVVKIKNGEVRRGDYERFQEYLGHYGKRFMLIDQLLSDNEIRNLIRCCDCFVSLHRSEGFGLGLTAAMFLGKPVVATAYSGNLDYMNESNSCLVRHRLCDVPDGAYPFSKGQVWADPDISHAVDIMERLIKDVDYAQEIGKRASRHIRTYFSNRITGLRYLKRLNEILSAKKVFSNSSIIS
jgi:glycosyltransferase involved in cell wall biosynthesis